MCLVHECWTGLHEMAMAAFESQYIDKDTYSASAEDIKVQSCFLDDQLTNLSPPRNCMPPDALRLVSTQALIDAVTTALPSPPLPPPLYMPPPIDRRDDIPEIEIPHHKRLCLSTLGSMYEVRESSTARPTGGRGIDYGFVSTLDAEARRRGIREVRYGIRDTWVDPTETVPEIALMTVRERVDLLMEDRIAYQETIQIVEEQAYDAREAWAHR
nr:hypothetical protein [Tanacetum cinerariifolium]